MAPAGMPWLGAPGSGGGDDARSAATVAETTSTTAASTTTTVALQGMPLVIAEQGVSTFPDLADPQATLGGYGVVILNPDPALMATGVRVVTRILDPDGAELLVVRRPGGGELLVPFVQAIVPTVDVVAGHLVVDPPEGLLEL